MDSARATTYSSERIIARRSRILRETRLMLVEGGYDEVTIRELARRADVAQRTLYNAFGSRENIVAAAIIQYYEELDSLNRIKSDPISLLGELKHFIATTMSSQKVRAYARATMSLYNSFDVNPAVRAAVRTVNVHSMSPFSDYLESASLFRPHVSGTIFVDTMTILLQAVLSAWCLEEISDDTMLERMAETFLVTVLGYTTPPISNEAETWLAHVRAKSPEWLRLCADCAVSTTKKGKKRSKSSE